MASCGVVVDTGPTRCHADCNDDGGGGVFGIRHVLRKSLEALLKRDEAFARAFLRDRRTFERIVKHVVIAGQQRQPQPYQHQQRQQRHQQQHHQQQQHQQDRVERSAALHCIVLAFRLAPIDEYTSEISAPVLMAGALSGVIEYPYLSNSSSSNSSSSSHSVRDISTAIDAMSTTAMMNTNTKGLDHHDNQEEKTRDNKEWPSTPLSSAQELASHAVVNPLVCICTRLGVRFVQGLRRVTTRPAARVRRCSKPRGLSRVEPRGVRTLTGWVG